MKDEELKNLFQSVPLPEIDRDRKEKTIKAVLDSRQEVRGLTHITYLERLFTMAGYISPMVWITQAVICMVCGLTLFLYPDDTFLECCAVVTPLLGCVGFVEIQKDYTCHMWEMEKSCRYDLRQVLLMKMQITGGVDVLLLLLMAALGMGKGISLSEAALAVAVPFFLSASIYLGILFRTDRKISNYILIALGVLLAVLSNGLTSQVRWLELAEQPGFAERAALLTLAAADVMLLSIRHFWKNYDREEKTGWNFE